MRDDLEEIECDASAPLLDALLDRIEAARAEALCRRGPSPRPRPQGRFLVRHFDGTLETGEAEVSSRNFFDVRDRPPISLWLETLTHSVPGEKGSFGVALLAFIPEGFRARAEAGRRACPNGSLVFLDELRGDLPSQLGALLEEHERT